MLQPGSIGSPSLQGRVYASCSLGGTSWLLPFIGFHGWSGSDNAPQVFTILQLNNPILGNRAGELSCLQTVRMRWEYKSVSRVVSPFFFCHLGHKFSPASLCHYLFLQQHFKHVASGFLLLNASTLNNFWFSVQPKMPQMLFAYRICLFVLLWSATKAISQWGKVMAHKKVETWKP